MKKNLIMNNLSLKILALLTSILLWVIVINISDPVSDTTISAVPITIVNANSITDKGQIYQISSDAATVAVTVSAKRTILSSIRKEDIRASIDLEELANKTGSVKVRLESTKYTEEIEALKAKTEYIDVKVEELLRKQIIIASEVSGETKEGYVIGDVTMDQNVVRVSGPKSIVEKVDRATVEASVLGMDRNMSTNSEIRLLDAKGNLIQSDALSKNIVSVSLLVEIIPTKEVPIVCEVSGTPAPGYIAGEKVLVNPEKVVIAGKANLLKDISKITIPSTSISLNGKSDNFTTKVDISSFLENGVKLADETADTMVTVLVEIEEKETITLDIPVGNLKISGLDEEWEPTLVLTNNKLLVPVEGRSAIVSDLQGQGIKGTIDFEQYKAEMAIDRWSEKTYDIPLQLELEQGVNVVAEYRVKVKLKKKAK